jgi:ankyrin repeat protein
MSTCHLQIGKLVKILNVLTNWHVFLSQIPTFTSILEFYIKSGCDLNERDDFPCSNRSRKGFTPLLLAIEQRKFTIAQVLIEMGANVNVKDSAGFTPLHWAALVGDNLEIVKLLLDKGAKIDAVDGVKHVLHIAVDEGKLKLNYG